MTSVLFIMKFGLYSEHYYALLRNSCLHYHVRLINLFLWRLSKYFITPFDRRSNYGRKQYKLQ